MPEEHERALRTLVEACNNKDIKRFGDVYDPNVAYHGTGELAEAGRSAFVQFIGAIFEAFPDVKLTLDDVFSSGDKVAYRLTVTGTHKAELMGIPATNRAVTVRKHWYRPRLRGEDCRRMGDLRRDGDDAAAWCCAPAGVDLARQTMGRASSIFRSSFRSQWPVGAHGLLAPIALFGHLKVGVTQRGLGFGFRSGASVSFMLGPLGASRPHQGQSFSPQGNECTRWS